MKAAVLRTLNEPLTVENIGLTDLQIGQVLVKVIVSGLCGAQLQEIRGEKSNGKFLPHLLGHEGCGTVLETGPGVTRVKIGDKVIMHWRKTDGIEAPFPSYILDDKKISSGKITTLSECSIVSENRLTPVPQDTPNELCALLGCGLSTALGTINNDADIKFGETVVVLGCGGVGINLIQGAILAGAGIVYGVDRAPEKQALVEKFGGVFVSSDSTAISSLKNIDCIIDATGALSLVSKYIPLLSERGRVIMVCQPSTDNSLTFSKPSNFFLGEGQSIKSTQGGKIIPSQDFTRYINFYMTGRLNIKDIVTHNFDLEHINDAVETLKSGIAGRILIHI